MQMGKGSEHLVLALKGVAQTTEESTFGAGIAVC
jgi:hypothetical protein